MDDRHGIDWILDEARGFEEMGEEFCSLETSKLLREAEFARGQLDGMRELSGTLGRCLDRATKAMVGGAHA